MTSISDEYINMNDISLTETFIGVFPPEPPPLQEELFVPGEFKYVSSTNTREMLRNAYQAINQSETWPFIRNDIKSFMFSDAPEIKLISKKMAQLGYYGHSGFSFGWTIRQMQFIAKNGEEEYKKLVETL